MFTHVVTTSYLDHSEEGEILINQLKIDIFREKHPIVFDLVANLTDTTLYVHVIDILVKC